MMMIDFRHGRRNSDMYFHHCKDLNPIQHDWCSAINERQWLLRGGGPASVHRWSHVTTFICHFETRSLSSQQQTLEQTETSVRPSCAIAVSEMNSSHSVNGSALIPKPQCSALWEKA